MCKYFLQLNKSLVLLILLCLIKFKLNSISLDSKINDGIDVDVTVIGYNNFAHGLGRLPIGFIENFKDKLKINLISPKRLLSKNNQNNGHFEEVYLYDQHIGNVIISFILLPLRLSNSKEVIKVAYSMFESTKIPDEWVRVLNEYFDLVVVPSKFLTKVYKRSGVNIPIFKISPGLYLDSFLDSPVKNKRNKPFVFGCSAAFLPRKNQELLLNAFLDRFGNNRDVILKLQGWYGDINIINKLNDIIKSRNAFNVQLITEKLNAKEYLAFMQSLDCYVLISKGEGFSVTPRESIALGIPTIISNNTAHKILCKTPYFVSVKSDIKEPADYNLILGDYYGYDFNTDKPNVIEVLDKVYTNYEYYFNRAQEGRHWVKKYTYNNLEQKYLNLVKPQKITLGDKNKITSKYLMTNSKNLYGKYLSLYLVKK